MIKRFFTKKSVAFLAVVILMAVILPFHSAHAESIFTSWIGKAIGTVTEFSANSVVGIVKALIEYVLIPIASIWIAITGTILDYSIQFTIYGDGITMLKTSMNSVWTLLRDVFNISFIFLLLYAAISQIVTGSFKKAMVTSIIISAVLINFSFFFTRILVDASNIVATAIYNQIDAEQSQKTENFIQKTLKGFTSVLTGEASKIDLSGRIMDGLNLTSILSETVTNMSTTADAPSFITKAGITWTYLGNGNWQSDKNRTHSTTDVMQTFTGNDASTKIAELTKQANEYDLKHPSNANTSSKNQASNSNNNDPKSIVGIGGLINSFTRWVLFIITALIFTFFAVIFIGRFVSIIILMVTSPIGFVGGSIPGMGGFAKSWKDNLTNQLLIAPVIMFFMLLTIRLSTILRNSLPVNPSPVVVFFNFFLVAFLLLKSVSITKKMSGAVGGFADKIGGLVSGLALGAATGGTALVGRQVVGRAADVLSKSKIGQDIKTSASKGGFIGGTMGLLDKGIEKTAKSTFDVRGTKSFGTIVDKAQGMSDSNLIDKKFMEAGGKYKEGTGYSGLVAQQQKDALEAAKKAEKDASAYEQRVVDRNPELKENYIKDQKSKIVDLESQKKNLEDQLKDKKLSGDKKKEIQVDIGKLSTNISEIEKSIKDPDTIKASDILKPQLAKLSDAQEKINKFKERENKIKEGLETAQGRWKDILEKEMRDIQTDKQKILDEINKIEHISEIKTIKDSKENRKNISRNVIQAWLSTRSGGERSDMASKIMREKPKEKTPEDKRNDALIEKMEKIANKKD